MAIGKAKRKTFEIFFFFFAKGCFEDSMSRRSLHTMMDSGPDMSLELCGTLAQQIAPYPQFAVQVMSCAVTCQNLFPLTLCSFDFVFFCVCRVGRNALLETSGATGTILGRRASAMRAVPAIRTSSVADAGATHCLTSPSGARQRAIGRRASTEAVLSLRSWVLRRR